MKTHLLERPLYAQPTTWHMAACGRRVVSITGKLSEVTCVHCLSVIDKSRDIANTPKEERKP